jgi:DNA ligase-1
MLAQPISKVGATTDSYFRQYKYDGMRCMIHRGEDGFIAYSRGGKRIETISHILKGLEMPVGTTIDGELYMHGTPLQSIMSYAKRYQNETRQLHYIVYDVMRPVPYQERLDELKSYKFNGAIRIAPTHTLGKDDSLDEEFRLARTLGYEGLILREPHSYYEQGKRSKALIKVKSVLDDEFTIQDITSSVDGWAILHCINFSVSAPGELAEKRRILQHRSDYLGRRVRVEFANYTRDGVPFHPVATNIV